MFLADVYVVEKEVQFSNNGLNFAYNILFLPLLPDDYYNLI